MSPLRNLRLSLRLVRKHAAVSAVVVLSLALGIGANTAVFSVVRALLWQPPPYPEPKALVMPAMVDPRSGIGRGPVSYPDFLDWRAQDDVFEQVALVNLGGFELSGEGEPERLTGASVSEDFFPLVRGRPLHGRGLEPDDYAPDAERVVVVSAGLWQRRFGGRRDAVGETLRLSDVPHTIVGVMNPASALPGTAELWVPFRVATPLPESLARRDNFSLRAVARLAPGVERAAAQTRVDALADRVAREMPGKRAGIGFRLLTLNEWFVGSEARLALGLVFGTVFFVLVIVCFNVGNLLLARAVERRREIAVRLALGAGRRDLLAQLLTESLVVAGLGAAAGLALAGWGLALVRGMAPARLPGLAQVGLDPVILLFALALTLVTALLFGVAPAWQLVRVRLNDFLRDVGVGGGGGARRLRGVLVTAEIAVSLVLLVVAGLMVRNLGEIARRGAGFELEHRLTMELRLPRARYADKPQRDAFFAELMERLERLPRVERVSASGYLPLSGSSLSRVHLEEGAPEPPVGPEYRAYWNTVSFDYFRTMAIPLVRGRAFNPDDIAGAPPVVIVNQAMAESMFPGQDPLGKRIRSWRDENLLREIVGVVGDVRYRSLGETWNPMVYVPYEQTEGPRPAYLVVRTVGDPAGLFEAVRAEIWDLDPALPVTDVFTFEELADRSIRPQRYVALALGTISPLALLLASIGLYGLMAYSVSQRTREIGLRMALGARAGDLVRMIVRQGAWLCAVGGGVGLLLALGLSHVLGRLLAISPRDPWTYLGVAALLAGAVVLACLGPAWRAARVDPLTALRYE